MRGKRKKNNKKTFRAGQRFFWLNCFWLVKKDDRNWTLAALDGISYNNHSSRLAAFLTILQHCMDIVLCSSPGMRCLMFLLKWWPEKTESQSLCCKVTNKPPVCRALLLKKWMLILKTAWTERDASSKSLSGPYVFFIVLKSSRNFTLTRVSGFKQLTARP